MDFLSTAAVAVLSGLNYLLGFFLFLLFANMILSFVHADANNGIVRFVQAICEPPCRMIRRRFPGLVIRSGGAMIDLSPMIVMLGIGALRIMLGTFIGYFESGGSLGL
jgi:uncharacterized protein YggT (Ycf19 family)